MAIVDFQKAKKAIMGFLTAISSYSQAFIFKSVLCAKQSEFLIQLVDGVALRAQEGQDAILPS